MGEANDIINLDLLPKEGDRLIQALEKGLLVVARSKNDFLYIIDFGGQYHMFTHTPGSQEGGQKQFPKDEKYLAVIKNLAELADGLYSVEYDRSMNLYGVMSSAENAILSMFPDEGRDTDDDEEIEFIIPGENGDDDESTNQEEN